MIFPWFRGDVPEVSRGSHHQLGLRPKCRKRLGRYASGETTLRGSLVRFHLYRYQLLPVDRYFQGHLYGAKSADELLARKNEVFAEVLAAPAAFSSTRPEITAQRIAEGDSVFVCRIAANRVLQHETKEFTTEIIDNWPKILVVIWNAPQRQLVAVQCRTTVGSLGGTAFSCG